MSTLLTRIAIVVCAIAIALPIVARAASGDIEVDPIAYVLDGHSIHVGLRLPHQRFDLGNFAAAAPRWFHGNAGFAAYFSGLGAKWDVCWRESCNGLFAGIDVSVAHNWVTLEATGETTRRRQLSAGIRGGYRFAFRDDGKGFFIVPWASFGYTWFSRSITLGGRSFNDRHFGVFPTVHVGYAF